MKLNDIADINIGVVLKRKEATYKGEKTYHYKVFNIRCFEEDIDYDEFYSMFPRDNEPEVYKLHGHRLHIPLIVPDFFRHL